MLMRTIEWQFVGTPWRGCIGGGPSVCTATSLLMPAAGCDHRRPAVVARALQILSVPSSLAYPLFHKLARKVRVIHSLRPIIVCVAASPFGSARCLPALCQACIKVAVGSCFGSCIPGWVGLLACRLSPKLACKVGSRSSRHHLPTRCCCSPASPGLQGEERVAAGALLQWASAHNVCAASEARRSFDILRQVCLCSPACRQ